jgi:hypothetical protein
MTLIVHKRLGVCGFYVHTPYIKSEQIFQMSRNWGKSLAARRMSWRKCRYWRPTNIRRRRKKIGRPGVLNLRICTPLFYKLSCSRADIVLNLGAYVREFFLTAYISTLKDLENFSLYQGITLTGDYYVSKTETKACSFFFFYRTCALFRTTASPFPELRDNYV